MSLACCCPAAKPMRIKEDILACTAAELNYGLAQFVKEITRPNGERYEPDSIYYLCLGIQQVRGQLSGRPSPFAAQLGGPCCHGPCELRRGSRGALSTGPSPSPTPRATPHTDVFRQPEWQTGHFPGELFVVF